MSKFRLLGGVIALVAAATAPAFADLRIEERATTLDSATYRWIFVKGDRRSVVSRQEANGLLYNAGARYGARVEIARPDRELIWELDPQEKSYREVTAEQLSRILQRGIQAPRDPNDQPLRTLYRSETTAIEVNPTGKTRRIAGLDAEEIVARVIVGAQNLQSGNRFNYTFDQTLWITRDERVLKEVRGFEEAYVEAFGTPITLAQAELLSGAWNDAFITHVRAMGDRVRALGGFPLSVSTTVTEEAIAAGKGEKNNSRQLHVGSVEVKKVEFDSVADSEFELPVGYINRDTKVAVAPRPEIPVESPRETPAPAPVPAPPVPLKVARADAATPGEGQPTAARDAAPGSPTTMERPRETVATQPPVPRDAVTGASQERPRETAAPRPVVATAPQPPARTEKKAEPVIVPGVPTNIASSNDDKGRPKSTTFKPKTTPVLVTGYNAVPIRDNIPVLSRTGVTKVVTSVPVTVEEPDLGLKPKRKK